jgi:transcriptional regulator of acetoin/glycerol metabolism
MNRTTEAISSETMEALSRYAWPENIREPQNGLELIFRSTAAAVRAVLESETPDVLFCDTAFAGGSFDDFLVPLVQSARNICLIGFLKRFDTSRSSLKPSRVFANFANSRRRCDSVIRDPSRFE